MGDVHTKVYAVGNAGYDELFYSGAEDVIERYTYNDQDGQVENFHFSGDVDMGADVSVSDAKVHSGMYSLEVGANKTGFSVLPKTTGDYRASVWVHKDNYTNTRLNVDNETKTYNTNEVIFAGGWVQLNFNFSAAANQRVYINNVSGTAYYDDFRMHPIESSMTSYVYNEWDELTCILGTNNLGTKYIYDDAGRLKETHIEYIDEGASSGGFKPSSEVYYNYKKQK